jgi:hypothetical protein
MYPLLGAKGLAPTILELSAYANYNNMQSLVPLKATKVKKKKKLVSLKQ